MAVSGHRSARLRRATRVQAGIECRENRLFMKMALIYRKPQVSHGFFTILQSKVAVVSVIC
jgi:hypothetical protein